MKGKIGGSMTLGGETTTVLSSNSYSTLNRARDIVKVPHLVDPEALDVCKMTLDYPLYVTHNQKRLIYGVWMELAKAGKLRGIRKLRAYKQLTPP